VSEPLLPKRFLFRFSLPCLYRRPLWTDEGAGLDAKFRLVGLAELEGRPMPAEVRAAWSEEGLAFSVLVDGKQQAPWCRASKPEDSDGVQLWIDTRDVHNVHRATRFCHRFIFLPSGGGNRLDRPVAQWLPINRAKEHPRPHPDPHPEGAGARTRPESLRVLSRPQEGGYVLDIFIAAEALTGFDPQEHPRLGFTYAVLDRELGEQTLGVGSPMPYQEDPSLWATLELVRPG
jgi:hypothetical protein